MLWYGAVALQRMLRKMAGTLDKKQKSSVFAYYQTHTYWDYPAAYRLRKSLTASDPYILGLSQQIYYFKKQLFIRPIHIGIMENIK